MSKSVIKEKSEPSLTLVFVYAGLLAALGVLLGFIFLMPFPLEAYANLQEREKALEARESLDPIPGDAFYIEGPTLRSRAWETKRGQILDGSARTVTVTVGELNAWLEGNFRGSSKPAGEESEGLALIPDTPNIGISNDGTTYLSLTANITGYGLDGDYVLSAKVSYGSGQSPSLKVEHLQIGGAAVPLPSILGEQLVSAIMKSYAQVEEYVTMQEAWGRVQSVEVEQGGFVLSLKAR